MRLLFKIDNPLFVFNDLENETQKNDKKDIAIFLQVLCRQLEMKKHTIIIHHNKRGGNKKTYACKPII